MTDYLGTTHAAPGTGELTDSAALDVIAAGIDAHGGGEFVESILGLVPSTRRSITTPADAFPRTPGSTTRSHEEP